MGRTATFRDRPRDCRTLFLRTASNGVQMGVQRGDKEVAHGSHAPRHVFGVAVTTQTVVLVLSVLVVGALVGFAVLNWLERLA